MLFVYQMLLLFLFSTGKKELESEIPLEDDEVSGPSELGNKIRKLFFYFILVDSKEGAARVVYPRPSFRYIHQVSCYSVQACPILTTCSSREFKIQVVQLVPVVRVVK